MTENLPPDLWEISLYNGRSDDSAELTILRKRAQNLFFAYRRADDLEDIDSCIELKGQYEEAARELFLKEREERRARRNEEYARYGTSSATPRDVDVYVARDSHNYTDKVYVHFTGSNMISVEALEPWQVDELIDQLFAAKILLETGPAWITRNIGTLNSLRESITRLQETEPADNHADSSKRRIRELRRRYVTLWYEVNEANETLGRIAENLPPRELPTAPDWLLISILVKE